MKKENDEKGTSSSKKSHNVCGGFFTCFSSNKKPKKHQKIVRVPSKGSSNNNTGTNNNQNQQSSIVSNSNEKIAKSKVSNDNPVPLSQGSETTKHQKNSSFTKSKEEEKNETQKTDRVEKKDEEHKNVRKTLFSPTRKEKEPDNKQHTQQRGSRTISSINIKSSFLPTIGRESVSDRQQFMTESNRNKPETEEFGIKKSETHRKIKSGISKNTPRNNELGMDKMKTYYKPMCKSGIGEIDHPIHQDTGKTEILTKPIGSCFNYGEFKAENLLGPGIAREHSSSVNIPSSKDEVGVQNETHVLNELAHSDKDGEDAKKNEESKSAKDKSQRKSSEEIPTREEPKIPSPRLYYINTESTGKEPDQSFQSLNKIPDVNGISLSRNQMKKNESRVDCENESSENIPDEEDFVANDKKSKISDNHSVVSSYIFTAPKMISGINESFAPSVYTRSNMGDTMSNFLSTEGGHGMRLISTGGDDMEVEITNENGEGFKAFIETPRSSNVNFKRGPRDNANVICPQFKEIYDKIRGKEKEIKIFNEKLNDIMGKLQKCEEENKKFDRWIEKEESDGETLRHMLNFLTSK